MFNFYKILDTKFDHYKNLSAYSSNDRGINLAKKTRIL